MAAHRCTPETLERLRLLAELGHGGPAIARQLNWTAEGVRKTCVRVGIRLRPHRRDREVRFVADEVTRAMLVAAADRRGVTVARLCRQLIETIAHDGLADAVIDAPPARPPRPQGH